VININVIIFVGTVSFYEKKDNVEFILKV